MNIGPIKADFRSRRDADKAYILDTFKKTMRSEPPFSWMKEPSVWNWFVDRLNAVYDRSQATVAVNPDDADHILGYILYEGPNVCHFVYVKDIYRGIGLAKALWDQSGLQDGSIITHRTTKTKSSKLRRLNLVYDPFPVFTCRTETARIRS